MLFELWPMSLATLKTMVSTLILIVLDILFFAPNADGCWSWTSTTSKVSLFTSAAPKTMNSILISVVCYYFCLSLRFTPSLVLKLFLFQIVNHMYTKFGWNCSRWFQSSTGTYIYIHLYMITTRHEKSLCSPKYYISSLTIVLKGHWICWPENIIN